MWPIQPILLRAMRPISIRPTPATSHRYRSEEMCGTLPSVAFKLLPERHARALVFEGEMMWSTLTWFQNEEDAQRGDATEGSRRYFPVNGLQVNRLESDGRADGASLVLPSHGLVSKAAQSNHIFIYSTTLNPKLTLGAFTCVCVEIFDPGRLVSRIRTALARRPKARRATLIYDEVKYWATENPPEEVWALPDRLTMHKHESYRPQREYRFAFGTRTSAFDFENIECFVVHDEFRWPKQVLDPQVHRLKLRLGNLEDCCRVLEHR